MNVTDVAEYATQSLSPVPPVMGGCTAFAEASHEVQDSTVPGGE
jgi:hypothetical protein